MRILGGGGGARRGAKFPAGTRRRTDVISTSCAHWVFNKSVPNYYISHLKI